MQRIPCCIGIGPALSIEYVMRFSLRLCPWRENQSATMKESEQKWKRKLNAEEGEGEGQVTQGTSGLNFISELLH